jgi:hypothetical protein
MADPVVIDDGGSTRIKQLTDNSDMDGLIGAHSDLANGRYESPPPVLPRCTLTVVHINSNAAAATVPAVPLNTGDIVEIVSQNGQMTTVVYRVTRQLDITVSPAAGGAEPMVEARQSGSRRRYIVTNAGTIQTVTHVRGAVVTPVFAAAATTVYTMVHFA